MFTSILFVLLSLLVISSAILHTKLFDFKTTFANAVANFLFLIGGYALFITEGKTIYILPILFLVIRGLFLKNIRFSFILKDWKTSLIIIGMVSGVFGFLFWRFNQSIATNEDLLFWIRLGITNQRMGVENINVFYNSFGKAYNGMDLYHYLEIWGMNFGTVINGQSHLLNLYFFAYPLAVIVACFGIKEILQLYFDPDSKNSYFVISSVAFVLAGVFFFIHPWDTILATLKINSLPISGMGSICTNLKFCYILIIVLALLIYLKNSVSENFLLLMIALFFYIPVFPLVMAAILLWLLYYYRDVIRNGRTNLYVFLFMGFGFMVMYVLFGNHNGTTITGFSINELFSVNYWIKILPSIIMKTFIIPFAGFAPLLLLVSRRKELLKSKTTLFLTGLFFVCVSVWIVFAKNIDANQSFLLLFGAILPLLAMLIIWHQIFVKNSRFLGTLILLVYISPGVLKAINQNNNQGRDMGQTKNFVQMLTDKDRLLFLPNVEDLTSVYDFNERVYTGVNDFVLYNPKIELFSIVGAMKKDPIFFNPSGYLMYKFYRDNSPYFKECGYFDSNSECFYTFLKKNHINIICSKNKTLKLTGWKMTGYDNAYYYYRVL